MTDPLLAAAVADNLAWCAAVCRSHGTDVVTACGTWATTAPAPPLYPDVMTTASGVPPDAVTAALAARRPAADRAAVKDCFADLDLVGAGFTVLLTGSWIAGPVAAQDVRDDELTVTPVGAVGLAAWSTAWGGPDGVLLPALLDDPAVELLAVRHGPELVGGAIASTAVAEVVGLSNLFARDDPVAVRRAVTAHLAGRWPGRRPVGWEAGDDLVAALRAGARALGPLRVWVR